MAGKDTLHIDLFAAARDGQARILNLSDVFFQELDQEEILGGQLQVSITVKEGAGDIFHIHYTIEGEVKVTCDRCLSDLVLDIDIEDDFDISYAEEAPAEADVRYLAPNKKSYDFSWDIYEAVELSLPTQRTHAPEDCDSDMLARIQS